MRFRLAASLLCLAGMLGCSAAVGGGDVAASGIDAGAQEDAGHVSDPGTALADPGEVATDKGPDGAPAAKDARPDSKMEDHKTPSDTPFGETAATPDSADGREPVEGDARADLPGTGADWGDTPCEPECTVPCAPDGCGGWCECVCGDAVCGEVEDACPEDCGPCGDGVCGGRESFGKCPADCEEGCGDGQCSADEDAVGCPEDCPCEAECGDMKCGPDACGRSCGECPAGGVCDDSGQCACSFEECGEACCRSAEICFEDACCRPGCGGRSCGGDGCGGSCGECEDLSICWQGSCCAPSCEGRACGGDGCGGSCGECAAGRHCEDGGCVCDHATCEASCCAAAEVCFEGECCAPQCESKECGGNSCGGSCGECTANASCGDGRCGCDHEGCGEACCAEGAVCFEGACCARGCGGAVCGEDGCGGSCGSCEEGLGCANGRCECDAVEWARNHGGDKESTIFAVAPDGAGGFIFGGSDKLLRTYHDFWVGRASGEGISAWTVTGSGGGTFSGDAARGVIPAGGGGAFACGQRDDGYPNMDQGWARRVDAEGASVWSKVFGGSGFNVFHGAAPTPEGGVVCVGQTFAGTHYRGWWVKLAAGDGSTEGSGTWASSSAFDVVKGVTPHSAGGYVVTGSRGVQGLDNADYVSGGSMWVLRVNDSMSPVWSKAFGGASSEGYAVAEASDGGVLAVGYTNASGSGRRDLFAVRTGADGAQRWSALWGGGGDDVGRAVAAVEGGWLVAGYTEGSGRDLLLIALDDEGNVLWTHTRGGVGTQAAYAISPIPEDPLHFIVGGRSGSYGLLLKTGLCP
jgi:hypothetical protein